MRVLSTSQGMFLIFPSRGDLAKTVRNLGEHLDRVTKENIEAPYVYALTDEPDPEKIRPTIDEIKGKHGVDHGDDMDWFENFCISELDMTLAKCMEMVIREYGDYALEALKREAQSHFPLAFRR